MLTQLRSLMKLLITPSARTQAIEGVGVEPASLVSPEAREKAISAATATPQRARAILMLLLAFVISVAIIGLTAHFRDALLTIGQLGLVGLFVLSVLGNATVLIPAPVFVVACAAGPIYGPIATGLVAGLGSAIGEMTGYMAGYGGTAVLPQGRVYQRLHRLMERYGPLVIFALAALPNPFFDVGGLIAGVLKMHPLVFLTATFLGKAIRLTIMAYACASGLPWLTQFVHLRAP